jgi:hypothetical protein
VQRLLDEPACDPAAQHNRALRLAVARDRCHVVHTLLRDPRVCRRLEDLPPSFEPVRIFPWLDPPLPLSLRAPAPALLKQAAWERRAHVLMAVRRRRARVSSLAH